MHALNARLAQELAALAVAMRVEVSRDGRWVRIPRFPLPDGFSAPATPLLIGVPPLFPQVPPGVLPHGVFTPSDLRVGGRRIPNLFEGHGPSPGWSWLCFYAQSWDPSRDSFIRFLDLVRAELSSNIGGRWR